MGYPITFRPIYGLRKVFKVTELGFESTVFDKVHSPLPHNLLHVKGQKD